MDDRRRRFRELIARPGLVPIPGAYDALSAKIIEAAGFECMMAGGYAAIGSLLGEPDTGQSNMRDYADHYARICDAVSIPVYVDADTGFGGVNNVRQMIRAFEAAGVAAIVFSDQVFPNRCAYLPGKAVVPVEQYIAKLKAALDARRDQTMVIAARTDCVTITGLDDAIHRCQLFLVAGADYAKPQTVDQIDDIKRVIREVPSPHIATISQAAGRKHRDLGELAAAGVAGVSFPSAALFAAAQSVRSLMTALKRDNGLHAAGDSMIPLEDYYALVGLPQQLDRERRYDAAARGIAAS